MAARNVNVTNPGGDGNPGRKAKKGGSQSLHVITHPKKRRRQERAWARGAERPSGGGV